MSAETASDAAADEALIRAAIAERGGPARQGAFMYAMLAVIAVIAGAVTPFDSPSWPWPWPVVAGALAISAAVLLGVSRWLGARPLPAVHALLHRPADIVAISTFEREVGMVVVIATDDARAEILPPNDDLAPLVAALRRRCPGARVVG